jgi:hypothetical protein
MKYLIGILMLIAPLAMAELTATVEAGYSFQADERPTLSKLNLLGLPTVTVVGTITGSTLSTNSVGKVHLSTNVFDQITIVGGDNTTGSVNYDDWSIGVVSNKLALKTNGVAAIHVTTDAIMSTNIVDRTIVTADVATNTLTWANISSNTIRAYNMSTNWPKDLSVVTPATNDYVLIGDVSNGTNSKAATITSFFNSVGQAPLWSTNNLPVSTGLALNAAHNLGRAPYRVTGFLVCTNAEAGTGYEVGDRLQLSGLTSLAGDYAGPVLVGGNSSNVFAVISLGGNTVKGVKKISPWDFCNITNINWNLSVYAW